MVLIFYIAHYWGVLEHDQVKFVYLCILLINPYDPSDLIHSSIRQIMTIFVKTNYLVGYNIHFCLVFKLKGKFYINRFKKNIYYKFLKV